MNSSGLNQHQREAVEYIGGPLLVLAGAGSGKTRVITQKIAWLIREADIPARNILAVTFTNKAAREMKNRVSELLDSKLTRGLKVSTFHQLGLNILRSELGAAGLKAGFTLLDEPPDRWISPPSATPMPNTASSDVAYTFLDPDRSTALLVIRDLMRYREACETWYADGFDQAEALTMAAYEHFHQTPAPESREDLLDGIPSATSTLAGMVEEMRASGTKNLIVDLRGNTGGNSTVSSGYMS